MDTTWVCEACGKPKKLAGAHLGRKQTVSSDCWPCGRKRVFHRSSGNTTADAAGAGDDSVGITRALSNDDGAARVQPATNGASGNSPRTAPTANTAQFPGDSTTADGETNVKAAAAAAFQAWASSKIGAGGPRVPVPGATTVTVPPPTASAGAFSAARATARSPEQRPAASRSGPFAATMTGGSTTTAGSAPTVRL
eukprot:CAMPEP_0174866414 /NCGR_PEP_ID=MMETSP1114-20130205/62074_1 /TAXON_ID=312471 /ORGANISM="Neobodo designis, Strain CCAP 1951/1" /LENGTH=195 /DNA_ID=CAMNT_0016101575 /DNA_START=70 /DNA_END=654 /DNA_ORIENTATION=-